MDDEHGALYTCLVYMPSEEVRQRHMLERDKGHKLGSQKRVDQPPSEILLSVESDLMASKKHPRSNSFRRVV
ncbi:hypothetical protein L2E82_15160 [Cichorium intybus]|uniref:Uncharacterized protein n=1 Tax=Cichorium intybus TaxID=13427 RepID=A0ACB9F1M9_CICIN|nr:hypothetical protein L2E82_15160 [Cichorium intybus]